MSVQDSPMFTPAEQPEEVYKCCGLVLPGDELVCPVCTRWLHDTYTD